MSFAHSLQSRLLRIAQLLQEWYHAPKHGRIWCWGANGKSFFRIHALTISRQVWCNDCIAFVLLLSPRSLSIPLEAAKRADDRLFYMPVVMLFKGQQQLILVDFLQTLQHALALAHCEQSKADMFTLSGGHRMPLCAVVVT